MVNILPAMQETWVQFQVSYGIRILWKILWRRKWQPTPAFLLGKSHGQRSLVGHSPWGPKELATAEHTHSM